MKAIYFSKDEFTLLSLPHKNHQDYITLYTIGFGT